MDGWREWSARKESCFFTAEVTEKGLEPEQGREKKKRGFIMLVVWLRVRGNIINYLYTG